MVVAAVVIVWRLPEHVSFGRAVDVAGALGRMNVVSFDLDLQDRYNFWSGHHRRLLPGAVVLRHRPVAGAALPVGPLDHREPARAAVQRHAEDPDAVPHPVRRASWSSCSTSSTRRRCSSTSPLRAKRPGDRAGRRVRRPRAEVGRRCRRTSAPRPSATWPHVRPVRLRRSERARAAPGRREDGRRGPQGGQGRGLPRAAGRRDQGLGLHLHLAS